MAATGAAMTGGGRHCERERRNPVGDWRRVSGLGFGRRRELADISWIASRSFAMTVARGVPAVDTPHRDDGGERQAVV